MATIKRDEEEVWCGEISNYNFMVARSPTIRDVMGEYFHSISMIAMEMAKYEKWDY